MSKTMKAAHSPPMPILKASHRTYCVLEPDFCVRKYMVIWEEKLPGAGTTPSI